MRVYIWIFLFLLSAPSLLLNGQDAKMESKIERQVEKVTTYPNSQKQLDRLNLYYSEANRMDLDRISELMATGQPDIWYEVYLRYKRLKGRQDMVSVLPPTSLNRIGFTEIDYNDDIDVSSRNAAAFFYAHSELLLKTGDRMESQMAYDELLLVALMFNVYRDMDKMLRVAIPNAAENLKLEVHNNTGQKLNSPIISGVGSSFDPLRAIAQQSSNKKKTGYDFTIRIILNEINVSREQVKSKKYREERDILGDNYQVLDTISCDVTEHWQRKSSLLKGKIEYVDNSREQVVNTVPVSVESIFVHKYASLTGNIEAAGKDTRELVEKREAPYPDNETLIMDAVEKFREKALLIMHPYGIDK